MAAGTYGVSDEGEAGVQVAMAAQAIKRATVYTEAREPLVTRNVATGRRALQGGVKEEIEMGRRPVWASGVRQRTAIEVGTNVV